MNDSAAKVDTDRTILKWIAIGLSGVAFAFLLRAWQLGVPIHWTTWTMPFWVIANLYITTFAKRWPRAAWIYILMSLGLTTYIVYRLVSVAFSS